VDQSGEIIGSAVEKFATDMTNLAISKAKDHANAQGSIDGAQAGVARDATGRLIAPDLTNIDPTSFYGAAFLNKSSEVDARFAAYRDTVLEGVPEELLPQTIIDIDSIHASKRAGVLAAQAQFAAQALKDEHDADQDGLEQQLTDHIQSGADDPLMADYLVGQYNANNQRMVEARMMTEAEAIKAEKALVDRMDTEIFTTKGRGFLIEGDIAGFSKLQEEIQFDAALPEDVRANALNTLNAELNQWQQRENRNAAKAKAAQVKAHNQAETTELRRVLEGGGLLTPSEYIDGVERGRWGRAFGHKMALKSDAASQAAIDSSNARTVDTAITNVETGFANNVHPDVQALFTDAEAKRYKKAMAGKLTDQIKSTKRMTLHDLKLAVTLDPTSYNYAALREELGGRVERKEMSAEDASAVLTAHANAMVKLEKAQAPLVSAETKLSMGLYLDNPELKAREEADPSAYNPLDITLHPGIAQDALKTGGLTPGVKSFLKGLPGQSGPNLEAGYKLFNKMMESDVGEFILMDALGSNFEAIKAGAEHHTASGGDLRASHEVMINATKGDSSAADRRLSAAIGRNETSQEREDFHQDVAEDRIASEIGWFDNFMGWAFDVNHDPDVNADVNAFEAAGVDLGDFTVDGEALHYIMAEADRILMAQNPVTTDRTRAAEIATHRMLQLYSPVQIEDGTVEWRRGNISRFAMGDPGTPTILKDRWSPKVPGEDFRIRVTAHGIASPTGAGWSNEILDFRVIPGTENNERPTYTVWYKEGDQWSPMDVQLDDGSVVNMHYQWDYQTSGIKAMHDIHVDMGQNGTWWDKWSAFVRGETDGLILDSGPMVQGQDLIRAGEGVESAKYWREFFNHVGLGNLMFKPEERRQVILDQLARSGKPKATQSGIVDKYGGANINIVRSK
jgi:hypothetical protein